MLIERLPAPLRMMLPRGLFRIADSAKRVYLTFDDGPIPEATPEILDILDSRGVKATFFMVGDNVRKYPDVARMVTERGHAVGNHTYHHVKAVPLSPRDYEREVVRAAELIDSKLFRPPHGWLGERQWMRLELRGYKLVFYDLITRDYSRHVSAKGVFDRVKKYARPGSIIVFHDSLKSIEKLREVLPQILDWLSDEGYEFALIDRDTRLTLDN